MELGGSPAAGVFIHPGKGQGQLACQALPVAQAVAGLGCDLTLVVQGEAHHQGRDLPLAHQLAQVVLIVGEPSPGQGGQGGHREPEPVATCQADAAATHV